MSVLSWLKPATLALIVVAGCVLAPASVQAQVTVLRGSPSQPLQPFVQDNTQDNQSSNYSRSGYGDDYPYYGEDFPWGVGGVRRGFHGGGFHAGGFHGRGFGGFHGGGFHGGGFHGGGGHR